MKEHFIILTNLTFLLYVILLFLHLLLSYTIIFFTTELIFFHLQNGKKKIPIQEK